MDSSLEESGKATKLTTAAVLRAVYLFPRSLCLSEALAAVVEL